MSFEFEPLVGLRFRQACGACPLFQFWSRAFQGSEFRACGFIRSSLHQRSEYNLFSLRLV